MAQRPIGIFDSGLGGLSVMSAVVKALPSEACIYVADSAHAPYGSREAAFIQRRVDHVADFLVHEQGVKALVVACNTATAVAVNELRRRFTIPIVAIEPGLKPAITQTQTGVVGVLATTGTLSSQRFIDLVTRVAGSVRVMPQPCPGLVERIEAGDLHGPQTRRLLQGYVEPLIEQGADTLVLGCTHYPFLEPLLRELVDASVAIVHTGAAVARQLQRVLAPQALLREPGAAGAISFWSSQVDGAFAAALNAMWPGADATHLRRLPEPEG